MLSALSKRRLTTLINFMANLPKKAESHFNMKAWVMHNGSWGDVLGHHGIKKPSDVNSQKLIQCGMQACAFGWGATIPAFKRAGLKLAIRENTRFGEILEPSYKGARDLAAAAKFFSISGEQAEAMFGWTNKDETPKAWANRARNLIKQWESEDVPA